MTPAYSAVAGWGAAGGYLELGQAVQWPGDQASDRLAIGERIHRYAWAFDERRRDALGHCFTQAAVWEGNTAGNEPVPPIHGRDAIADWLAGFWTRQRDQRRHLMLNVLVSNQTAEEADALVSLALTAAENGAMAIVLTSFYRMQLAKSHGIWRIRHLFEGFDAAFEPTEGFAMTPDEPLTPVPGWGHGSGAITVSADAQEVDPEAAADRIALAELMYRYGWAFDERQPEVLASCFVDEATWEASLMGSTMVGPHRGRDAIMEFMTGFWPDQSDQRRHMIMNVLVEDQAASSATVFSYHLLMSAARGEMRPVTAGFYRVEATKTAEGWKMVALLAGYDVPF
jgi:predicted SnoaL-like aldol condensation-catalyzing enzyme